MTDIIDFEAERNRRSFAEIDADEANWNSVQQELLTIMSNAVLTGKVSEVGLTSATLRALLDMLHAVDPSESLDDRRKEVARTLACFR
jgi:hypothetical protein